MMHDNVRCIAAACARVISVYTNTILLVRLQFGNTALHEAAWNGNNDIVKILLNAFCFVDSINHSGFTPLHLASQNGHVKVVKTLLKWKADPTLCNQVTRYLSRVYPRKLRFTTVPRTRESLNFVTTKH